MLYIVRNLRTRPTHLITNWVNIRGILNPTLINRVNKLMTNNIKSTYNCHTFLESSGQVHETIYRVNICGYFESGVFCPHIQIGLRNLSLVSRDLYMYLTLLSSIVFVIVTYFCFVKSKDRSSKPLSLTLQEGGGF